MTLNRIIFRGKIHDKCHTLATVTRHGTRHIGTYLFIPSHQTEDFKSDTGDCILAKTQLCYQLLASTCFLLSSDKTQQREQTIEAWAARDTCCHLPGTGDRTSVTRPSSAWLLRPGNLGILLRHLNTQLRARTDGAWSSVTLQLKSEDLRCYRYQVIMFYNIIISHVLGTKHQDVILLYYILYDFHFT